MNKLWAPWRIKYITQKKKKWCIFCNAHKERTNKNFVVLRSNHCFVILNTFPYNNGHLMVVSNRHIWSLEKLTEEEMLDINKIIIRMTSTLRKIIQPDGFNIGINIGKFAGAGIDKHIHIHIVPRWMGDTNFMPVLTDTKIISQSLNEIYIKIKKCLNETI